MRLDTHGALLLSLSGQPRAARLDHRRVRHGPGDQPDISHPPRTAGLLLICHASRRGDARDPAAASPDRFFARPDDVSRARMHRRADARAAHRPAGAQDRGAKDARRGHRDRLARAPDGVCVSGDVYRLEQVVLNLLQNAIKYGQGSPVDTRLASDGASAVLEVTDRGIGISPDSLARIFQKYERAVSIENISGLGLGLYISRAVVEQHGGSIEVRSRLGEGSVFTVRLPLER